VRKFTTQGSLTYITNNLNRLETRDLQGQFQAEFTNSDVAAVTYTDNFDRPVRAFEVYPGIRVPVGAYDFRTLQLSYTGGQQRTISGQVVFETGPYYGGDRQSIAINTARMQITPQISLEPSLSLNVVDVPQGSFTATVLRTRATYTLTPRMFVSGIAQYNSSTRSVGSNLRLRWEYLPGSELFVVYTDDYNTDAPRDVTPLRNRALVVKINRLLRP
jgi:hypothetical protein